MPLGHIAGYVVRIVALEGAKSDFDELPVFLKHEVQKQLDLYRSVGTWYVISTTGRQDYGVYAAAFIGKVGYPCIVDAVGGRAEDEEDS